MDYIMAHNNYPSMLEVYTVVFTKFNAQFLFLNNMYVTLQSPTRFEHQHAHLQEDKLYYHSIWYRHSL